MQYITLKATKREIVGKHVKRIRKQGLVPAIIYGYKINPTPISLELRETMRILRGMTSSTLLNLELGDETIITLVREKQVDSLRNEYLHIDFLAVSMKEKLKADVVITFIGVAPAVTKSAAILITGVNQITVESLPQDLPERIEVDISVLEKIGDAVHVGDLLLPEGVTVLTDPLDVIIGASHPIIVPEEEETLDMEAEPQIIERGKKEAEEFD